MSYDRVSIVLTVGQPSTASFLTRSVVTYLIQGEWFAQILIQNAWREMQGLFQFCSMPAQKWCIHLPEAVARPTFIDAAWSQLTFSGADWCQWCGTGSYSHPANPWGGKSNSICFKDIMRSRTKLLHIRKRVSGCGLGGEKNRGITLMGGSLISTATNSLW